MVMSHWPVGQIRWSDEEEQIALSWPTMSTRTACSSPRHARALPASESLSRTPKYQALNELTLRFVWLMCEAWKDDPARSGAVSTAAGHDNGRWSVADRACLPRTTS
ncbi:hypothetical protein D9M68_375470 [compost metagenome]